jgi:hypothetical protein
MRTFLALCMILIANSASADSYLCLAESFAGFKYVNGKWDSRGFTTDSKYLLQPRKPEDNKSNIDFVDDFKRMTHVFREFGEKGGIGCLPDTSSIGTYECPGFGQKASISTNTLRFYSVHLAYITASKKVLERDKENLGTPGVEIGTCQKM